MNFYYHPILGLQYNPVFVVEKGNFAWGGLDTDKVLWFPDENESLSFLTTSQEISLN